MRTLSPEQARRFYDRFGVRQDSQLFYEGPALDLLLRHLDPGNARAIVDFGCGTGRFDAELLRDHAAPGCRLLALDVSDTMVELARERLRPFGERAEVRRTDGAPRIPAADGAFDRFVSTYVLDLLPEDAIAGLLSEAHRVLEPGGRLGVAGLGPGEGHASRAVAALWGAVHRVAPTWVGGCRPLDVRERLPAAGWRVRHHSGVAPYGIPSRVLVAERV